MRVGTSSAVDGIVGHDEDHPHACGDKERGVKLPSITIGSSPCVWGQVATRLRTVTLSRIIPMRVGTSTMIYNNSLGAKDHPHACGDKAELCAVLPYKLGSSPCVWGQVKPSDFKVAGRGIIPMRVGTRRPL